MTKECISCHVVKDIKLFHRRSNQSDGKSRYCKECAKKQRQRYARTKLGLITDLFNRHNSSYKRRGVPNATYTKEELMEFMMTSELFHKLHSEWIISGYEKKLTPSIDRIYDNKGYDLDNIQIMTWGENESKGHEYRANGMNDKNYRKVDKYTKDGVYLETYSSIKEAQDKLGLSHISAVCRGKRKSTGGYIWKYNNDESQEV